MRRRTFLQLVAASVAVGCDGSRLVDWPHGALAMAVTERDVYWTSGVDHSGLLRVARGGGEPVVLYDGMPWAVALCPGPSAMFVATGRGVERAPYVGLRGALLIAEPAGAYRVTVDGGELFWLVRQSGIVKRADLRGQGVATLAEGPPWANDMVVTADAVFWTSGEPGRLSRVPRAGGDPETIVSGTLGLGPLAVAGAHLYFGHATGVSRVPLAGGEPRVVAEGRRSPSSLLPLGDGVGWSELGPGEGASHGRIVRWSEGGEQAIEAGRVVAMATSGDTVFWIDDEAKALRRHAF